MSLIEKEINQVGHTPERRLVSCPKGGYCEVAKRQNTLVRELHDFKTEFAELKGSVEELVNILSDAKVVLSFFKKVGYLVRWLAVTAAAIGAIWAAITHWPKGH